MLPAPLLRFESLHQFCSALQLSCLCAKPLHLGTQSKHVPKVHLGDQETRVCLSCSDLHSSQPAALCWCTSVALTHKLYFNLHDTVVIYLISIRQLHLYSYPPLEGDTLSEAKKDFLFSRLFMDWHHHSLQGQAIFRFQVQHRWYTANQQQTWL